MDSVSRQLLLSGGAGVMPADPLSIWTMDSVTGNTVNDGIGSLPGTKTSSATVVAGRDGNGVQIVNESDYINMGNRKTAYDTAVNSVSMWVKFTSLTTSRYIFSNHNRQGGAGSTYNNGWLLSCNATGQLFAYNSVLNNEAWTDGGTGGGSGNSYTPRVSSAAGSVTAGVWYLITIVSGSTYITMYINNTLVGTTTHTQTKRVGTGDTSINGHYCFGDYLYDNGTALLSGQLMTFDTVRHYNFALTDANVTWLYFNT